MEPHNPQRKNRNDLYLSPATNRSAKRNLEIAITGRGIDIPEQLEKWDTAVGEVKEFVVDAELVFDKYQKAQEERETLEVRLRDLEQGKNLLSDNIDELHTRKGELENLDPGDGPDFNDSLAEVREELEARREEMDDLEQEIFETEQAIERIDNKLDDFSGGLQTILHKIGESTIIDDVGEIYLSRTPDILNDVEKTISEVEAAIEALAELHQWTGRDRVNLWAVRSSVWENHDVQPEDLILFYTGNERYEYAGTVERTFSSSELASVLWETGDSDDEFPEFILFENTRKVDIDAGLIADLADHNINYVIGFTRLNDPARDRIESTYDSLGEFIDGVDGTGSREETIDIEEILGASEPTLEPEEIDQAPVVESVDVDFSEPELSPISNLSEIAEEVARSKLVLLCGPSHTGKVPGARLLFDLWFSEQQDGGWAEPVLETTFTPAMTHHDFIEGSTEADHYPTIRPFRQFGDAAAASTWQAKRKQSKSPQFGVIIDAIHRADASDIFGPAWKVIDPSMRGPDNEIRLPESGAPFWLPESFYIIGCVDTDEKPLKELPRAVRNKFNIIRTDPDYEILRNAYGFESWQSLNHSAGTDADESFIASSILGLRALNNAIVRSEALSQADQIGHMVFLRATPEIQRLPNSSIRSAWTNHILPRLHARCEEADVNLWHEVLPEYEGDLVSGRDLSRGSDEALNELLEVLRNRYM